MVFILPFLGAAALLSGLASGLPRPEDSSINEPAVSAPNGIPITDTSELSTQRPTQTAAPSHNAPPAQVTTPPKQYESGGNNNNKGKEHHSISSWVATTTLAAAPSSSPLYGSGSSNWGNAAYNDCVSQCMAQHGAPPASYTPPPTHATPTEPAKGGHGGNPGNGVTHTVIVAPTQGVLRYVPFALNASVGDTIKFMWGANNHTVTKGSALLPCNRTTEGLFTSGLKNKDFVFTQVVNDTNPTYFFCNAPTHCQKGMFGIINPPAAFASPKSFSGMVQSLSAANPNIGAYATVTKEKTAGNPGAANWGGNIDVGALPTWAHSFAAENILFTRNFLASNPEVLQEDGFMNLGNSDKTPLMIPPDVAAALSSNAPVGNAGGSPSSSASSTPAASSSAPSGTSTTGSQLSGASSLASPRLLVGFAVAVATFFAL